MNVIQAGLRAVHDLGPEIRRAISGNLEEDDFFLKSEEPAHRVRMRLRLDLKFDEAFIAYTLSVLKLYLPCFA